MLTFIQNSNTASKVIENASLIPKVILDSVDALLTKFFERLPYFVAGILVLVVFWLAGKIVRSIFLTASEKTKLDARLRILFSRLLVISLFVIGIFTALTVIIPTFSFGDLIAGLGFTSFIVGFATKDILNNLFSGVLILWQQPFQIGDYIFVKDKQGKVEYIGVRATTLRMDDGEMILMPNGDMYSNALTIRGMSAERRMKLEISIGYDAEIELAKTSVLNVLQAVTGVVKEPNPSVFVTELAAAGVNLSIYFWIKTSETKPMEVFDEVATRIKNALSEAKIELFPLGAAVAQNTNNKVAAQVQDEKEIL